ncbi:hypothetical protein [Streptomyces sp. NPDC001680]
MPDEEVTPPTVAQVEAVARAMPPYLRATIVTLAGSGLRRGELLRIYAPLRPGEEDRTRTAMDAVLGGLRTGCGQGDTAIKEIAGQRA